jgi:hypothetical protein
MFLESCCSLKSQRPLYAHGTNSVEDQPQVPPCLEVWEVLSSALRGVGSWLKDVTLYLRTAASDFV